jgi:DNA-binding ferritin-like protein
MAGGMAGIVAHGGNFGQKRAPFRQDGRARGTSNDAMAIDLSTEHLHCPRLRRIVADAVMLRFQTEKTIWNLDATSAGAAIALERVGMQLDALMRDVAIRMHVLQGSTEWSLDEIRSLSSVPGSEIALASLARELERLCEDCRAVMKLARDCDDARTERLLAARCVPLEQALWGLNQVCRLSACATR